MSKLKRYENFESLKADATPTVSKQRANQEMEIKKVFAALRRHLILPEKSKENIVKANGA